MQETPVQSLVQEDYTCCKVTKPTHLNYWAYALEPVLGNKRSHQAKKPAYHDLDSSLCSSQPEKVHAQQQRPREAKNKHRNKIKKKKKGICSRPAKLSQYSSQNLA